MTDRDYYTIGYNDEIILHGAAGDVWPIDLEEAKERKRQLEECIERREELVEDE